MLNAQPHLELLGMTARDRITGFEGTVTTISFDLYGCAQAILTMPKVDKENKPQSSHWLDTNRLEIRSTKRVVPLPNFGPLEGSDAKGAPKSRPDETQPPRLQKQGRSSGRAATTGCGFSSRGIDAGA